MNDAVDQVEAEKDSMKESYEKKLKALKAEVSTQEDHGKDTERAIKDIQISMKEVQIEKDNV